MKNRQFLFDCSMAFDNLYVSGVGAWTDWTYRDGFMDVFKKVDVSVHTSMCDGRMGRIWTYPSIKNGRIKDELFA